MHWAKRRVPLGLAALCLATVVLALALCSLARRPTATESDRTGASPPSTVEPGPTQPPMQADWRAALTVIRREDIGAFWTLDNGQILIESVAEGGRKIYALFDPQTKQETVLIGLANNGALLRITATSLGFLCRSMDDTADVVFPYLLVYDLQTRQHSRARVYLPVTTGVSLGNPDGARFSTLTSVSATEDELRLGLKSHTVFTVPPATTVFAHDKSEFIVELPGLAADPQLSLPRRIDAQGSVLKSVLVESGDGDAARTGISVRVALDPAKRDRITYTAEERPAEDGQGVVVIFQFSDQEPATDLSPAYPR